MSSPKGASLNDAIDTLNLEKLNMSSPKLFAEELVKAGKVALFSKSDIVDAYKLIPNAVKEWRLFGFQWLGKFFFDKMKVFGSKEAPASFDSLPETIVNIVCTLYQIPKSHVQRQLDDKPMVASSKSKLTEKFTNAYKGICKKVNIPLAPDCPKHEKAFEPATFGTVLGVQFDSSSMEWSISHEKEQSLQSEIDFFLENRTCTLKQVQKLLRKLANFAQTMVFMKGFRFDLLALLNKFEGQEGKKNHSRSSKTRPLDLEKMRRRQQKRIPPRRTLRSSPSFPCKNNIRRSWSRSTMGGWQKQKHKHQKRQRGSLHHVQGKEGDKNLHPNLAFKIDHGAKKS
jgi:hypothetical protein